MGSDINYAWGPQTLNIVRTLWGKVPPWEIAREINRYLYRPGIATPKADGTPRRGFPVTASHGGGVIWKAWELGLVEGEEWRDALMAKAKRQAKPYLSKTCPHDLAFKDCQVCYFGRGLASVALYHAERKEALFIDVEDLHQFEVEFAQDPRGFEIVGTREG